MKLALLLGVSLSAVAGPACAQIVQRAVAEAAPAKNAFEAASIHIVDPNAQANDMAIQPQAFPANMWRLQYITMKGLVCKAYTETDVCNIQGGPPWLDSRAMRYDITAKVEGNAMLSRDQMRPMLRTLLEERFHLKVHAEHTVVAGYALVIGKGGPKMTVHSGAVPGEFISGSEIKTHGTAGELASDIGWRIRAPIVDKTGLTGVYDFELKFAPAEGPLSDDPRFAGLPSIFTAVQEQLGLKLVVDKVPKDYVVVDGVDKTPTDN